MCWSHGQAKTLRDDNNEAKKKRRQKLTKNISGPQKSNLCWVVLVLVLMWYRGKTHDRCTSEHLHNKELNNTAATTTTPAKKRETTTKEKKNQINELLTLVVSVCASPDNNTPTGSINQQTHTYTHAHTHLLASLFCSNAVKEANWNLASLYVRWTFRCSMLNF